MYRYLYSQPAKQKKRTKQCKTTHMDFPKQSIENKKGIDVQLYSSYYQYVNLTTRILSNTSMLVLVDEPEPNVSPPSTLYPTKNFVSLVSWYTTVLRRYRSCSSIASQQFSIVCVYVGMIQAGSGFMVEVPHHRRQTCRTCVFAISHHKKTVLSQRRQVERKRQQQKKANFFL